ncbi:MAG: hypothetical protein DRQ78_02100 [Epsilonproteobacteria bacterium]|nr:MAG: hypothetical protein DRQ78_02100 [Campylobacterota bacterium]
MVRILLLTLLLYSSIFADNTYERNCVSCHKHLPVSLEKMFMQYILVYGDEKNVKAGLKHYLKYPIKDISLMSNLFISNYGIKTKSTLSDEEIDEILEIYWDKFKIFGKLN